MEDRLGRDGEGRAVRGGAVFFLLFLCVKHRALSSSRRVGLLGREELGGGGRRGKKKKKEESKRLGAGPALTFFFFVSNHIATLRNIPLRLERDGSSGSGSQVRGAALLRRLGLLRDRAGRGRRRKGVVGDPEPVRRSRWG